MIARRDMLKLAAALTATSTAHLPFSLSPDEARAWLDDPAELDPGEDRAFDFGRQEIPPGPTAFINRAVPHLPIDELRSDNPEEWAAYKQSLQRVIDVAPNALNLRFGNPMCDMDEAAVALWSAAWFAGVRLGAELEHVRLAMLSARQICPKCGGHGRVWGVLGKAHIREGDERICETCQGAGTVPAVVV